MMTPRPGMSVDELTQMNGGWHTPPGSMAERQMMFQQQMQGDMMGGERAPDLRVAGDGEPTCSECAKWQDGQCTKYGRMSEPFETCEGYEGDVSGMLGAPPQGGMQG